MGPHLVVVLPPGLDFLPRLHQAHKPVLVQALIAKLTVEAYDESILRRLARIHKVQLHPSFIRPLVHHPAGELRAIVHHDLASPLPQSFQSVSRRTPPVCDSPSTLPVAVPRTRDQPRIPETPPLDGPTPQSLSQSSVIRSAPSIAIARAPHPHQLTGSAFAALPNLLASHPPPRAGPWALRLFSQHRLKRLKVQRLLRHHLLQPPVFVFQALQPASFTHLQAQHFAFQR